MKLTLRDPSYGALLERIRRASHLIHQMEGLTAARHGQHECTISCDAKDADAVRKLTRKDSQ